MEFSRQEYWSGLPFPTPGDIPDLGIEPTSPVYPALASRFFTTEPPGKALASTDLFIVSVGLHFPECYIIGIIYRGTIPDWLLLLSNIH